MCEIKTPKQRKKRENSCFDSKQRPHQLECSLIKFKACVVQRRWLKFFFPLYSLAAPRICPTHIHSALILLLCQLLSSGVSLIHVCKRKHKAEHTNNTKSHLSLIHFVYTNKDI